MDVAKASDQIDELISKREKQREAANREEENWKAPTRRRRERIRKRNRAEWFAYFSGLAESHRKISEGFEARAAALLEDSNERRSA